MKPSFSFNDKKTYLFILLSFLANGRQHPSIFTNSKLIIMKYLHKFILLIIFSACCIIANRDLFTLGYLLISMVWLFLPGQFTKGLVLLKIYNWCG
jgi:hypothetical protein